MPIVERKPRRLTAEPGAAAAGFAATARAGAAAAGEATEEAAVGAAGFAGGLAREGEAGAGGVSLVLSVILDPDS